MRMRILPLPILLAVACWLSPGAGFCQEEPGASMAFTYGFSSCDDITGVRGSVYSKSVDCVLSTNDNSSGIGVESWSFCVQASNAFIRSITIEGTDAGDLLDNGWEINEVVNGGAGAISAALLSFRSTVTLPPEGVVSVAAITLQGIIPAGEDEIVSLNYLDGLRGSGLPVDSIVTYDGETMLPELGVCDFSVVPDRIPPAAPMDLEAEPGDGIVNLSWAANTEDDLAGYNLYRDGDLMAEGLAETAYSDLGVTNDSTYSYSVTALDTSGNESSASRPVEATPRDRTPPAEPGGLTAAAGNGFISLDWNDNTEDDLAGYNLYRNGELLSDGLDESAYNDNDVVNGVTYTYVVTATDHNGNESTPSLAIEATPELPPAGPFRRGDVNIDLRVDIADAIWMLGYLFAGGVIPQCNAAADSNADAQINVADPIFTLNWLFLGGAASPPPSSCDLSSNPGDIALGCSQPACEL